MKTLQQGMKTLQQGYNIDFISMDIIKFATQ